jgi:hypothetical protein
MGYTVFWSQKRNFTTSEWGLIRESAINMFNRLKQVKGGSGTGRPIIDNSDIIFNGDATKEEDHETFHLQKNGSGFQFCKTARKPYDRYVKAVLVVANFYAPGALKVSCDGDDEPDCWTEGVRIATIYAKGVPCKSPCSPLELKDFHLTKLGEKLVDDIRKKALYGPKSCDPSHEDPYKNVYPELDNIIKGLEMVSSDSKPLQFLVNYLKANIDDIKDAYTP